MGGEAVSPLIFARSHADGEDLMPLLLVLALFLPCLAYPTSVRKSFEVRIQFVEMSSGSYHISFVNPKTARKFNFAMLCKLSDGKLRLMPLSNVYTNVISKQALRQFSLHRKHARKSADDGGRNWDGGADCGGSSEVHHFDWRERPYSGGCHAGVVGSPGANGSNKFLDVYPKGLNGPDD